MYREKEKVSVKYEQVEHFSGILQSIATNLNSAFWKNQTLRCLLSLALKKR